MKLSLNSSVHYCGPGPKEALFYKVVIVVSLVSIFFVLTRRYLDPDQDAVVSGTASVTSKT